jgi:hypothetical protein
MPAEDFGKPANERADLQRRRAAMRVEQGNRHRNRAELPEHFDQRA